LVFTFVTLEEFNVFFIGCNGAKVQWHGETADNYPKRQPSLILIHSPTNILADLEEQRMNVLTFATRRSHIKD